MSVTTKQSTQELLDCLCNEAHPFCLACSRAHECSLGLHFYLQEDGSVKTRFECCPDFQGYEGVLHGGVTSTVLDAAMTNCLFAYGIKAVTADLNVRFRHPIQTSGSVVVTARILRFSPPLYVAEAELFQEGQLKAKSTGKFMQRNESTNEDSGNLL